MYRLNWSVKWTCTPSPSTTSMNFVTGSLTMPSDACLFEVQLCVPAREKLPGPQSAVHGRSLNRSWRRPGSGSGGGVW
jgi:hypothetical protein